MGRYQAKKIDRIVESVLGRRTWASGLCEADIIRHWPEIVGPKIAEHTEPIRLTKSRLEVRCDHDVWRTELQYLKPELLQKIATEIGDGVVKEIFLR